MSQTEDPIDAADVGDNSNASSSDTPSSRGKEGDFESKIETDRSKRFDFLLKQTEIFSHFMTNANKTGSSPPKAKAGRPKKIKEPETPSAGENGKVPFSDPDLDPDGLMNLIKPNFSVNSL